MICLQERVTANEQEPSDLHRSGRHGVRQTIEYGRRTLALTLPEERVVAIISPNPVNPVADVGAAAEERLGDPTGSPPLRELLIGKSTALIATVDATRPSPRTLLLPVLRQCRQAGVRASIVIAIGRHRQMTKAEISPHLGRDIVEQHTVFQHDPFDEARMLTKGHTARGTPIRVNRAIFEHDIVIGVGTIEPSYLCGWSGGRKILMPGLAHHASIDSNHFHLTHPDARIGRLHGNPVSDDAAEFASQLPLHFILYSVAGPNDETVGVVAGDPVTAHQEGCACSERIYRVGRIEADIVISSPGGAPYDFDLVQGKKAVIPATQAVKHNGVVIICAECKDGLGAEPTFIEWLRAKTPAQVTKDVLDREQFSLGAHGADILAKPIVEKNAKVVLVTSAAVARQLAGTYITAVTKLSDAWELANQIAGEDSSVLFIEKARRLIMP